MKKTFHSFSSFIVIFILLLVGVIAIWQVNDIKSSKDTRIGATAPQNCTGSLNAKVSVDGENPQLQITLVNPVRYYLHILSNGKPCSTNFDVRSKYCDTKNVCSAWKESTPWGSYRSNTQGVARIDLYDASSKPLPPGTYVAKFRPSGSLFAYGNEIQVVIPQQNKPRNAVSSASDSDGKTGISDLWKYYNATPGYTYNYTTNNMITGTTGISRLQIEEEVNWCGLRLLPWRFTKDSIDAYHYPWMFKTPWNPSLIQNRDLSTRWLMVSPSYQFPAQVSSYNSYITSIGEKRYIRNSMTDVPEANHLFTTITGSTTTQLPSYNLGLKNNFPVPYFQRSDTANYFYTFQKNSAALTQSTCPTFDDGPLSLYQPAKQPTGSWRLRAEFENISIKGKRFSYTGPSLRLDFYEGTADIDKGPINRETWYLVKNIGLVRLQMKNFNYATVDYKWGTDPSASTNCSEDSDCRGDKISSPDIDMILDEFYPNPQLAVAVSADGVNYSTSISTTKIQSYYLKTTNGVPYTGYLEALASGKTIKWYWMEKGVVRVQPSTLSSLAPGTYNAQFRIWVPNDVYTNETRVSDTNIPWSNNITVNLSQ